jgi:hypothetical protein
MSATNYPQDVYDRAVEWVNEHFTNEMSDSAWRGLVLRACAEIDRLDELADLFDEGADVAGGVA